MLQISDEISPVSLFPKTEYSKVDGGGIGSGPCSMLESSCKLCNLDHGSTTGCWSKLVKKFPERSKTPRLCLVPGKY